jgi:hypothetical protein
MSKTRAIQNTLGRLGMQASPKQVVAALADFGISVNERLVSQIKVEMLKEAAKVERQRLKVWEGEQPKHVTPGVLRKWIAPEPLWYGTTASDASTCRALPHRDNASSSGSRAGPPSPQP